MTLPPADKPAFSWALGLGESDRKINVNLADRPRPFANGLKALADNLRALVKDATACVRSVVACVLNG